MESVLTDKVLVLNRSWIAVNVATVRRALTLVFQDVAPHCRARRLFHIRFRRLGRSRPRSQSRARHSIRKPQIAVPEVIVLTAFNGRFSKEVRFSRRNIFERDENCCQYCGRKCDRSDLTLRSRHSAQPGRHQHLDEHRSGVREMQHEERG